MLRNAKLRTLLGAAVCGGLAFGDAFGYAFTVSPIRVDLGGESRTGVISVANDDQLPLGFQMRLMRWTQTADGEDRYEPSADLVYFPRVMTVDPQDKRVVRLGAGKTPPPVEESYRLYIEEMAAPQAAPGTAIAVRMRFAVPVFVAPAAPRVEAQLRQLSVQRRVLQLAVANTGNRHFRIDSIRLLQGGQPLHEAMGGYVLPGATRRFQLELPATACKPGSTLQVIAKGEAVELAQPLSLTPEHCAT